MSRLAILATLAGLTAATAAQAGSIVTNGSFSSTSGAGNGGLCSTGGTAFNDGCVQNITGWTNTSTYSFVSNAADLGVGYDGHNGHSPDVVLAGNFTLSPDGGNFLAVDADSNINANNSFSQTLTGLKVGDNYAVTFYQAAGQQTGFNGATTDQWTVSLGGLAKQAALMTDAQGSFSGWTLQTLVFNATSTSELLSFAALGGPNGSPPFALLDGVSVADVPEPAEIATLGAGLLALTVVRRRRRAV